MLSEAQSVVATGRFQRQLATLRSRTGERSRDAWDQLGSWDRADIERFERSTAPLFRAARRASVNSSAGYYQLVTDTAVTVGELAILPQIEAPFHAYWSALKDGSMWADALAVGAARAEAVGTDLITGASREVASLASQRGVVGWRRVLTGVSCEWCGTVAQQRYKTVDSATFGHDHCDCIVAPIYAESDPGQRINAEHVSTVASTLPVRV